MWQYRKFTVLVECMTYNQSQFIEDAMNGFVMQQTDFPFVCLIVDDASTDGEQHVINSYLHNHFDMEHAEYAEIPEAEIVLVPHRTNSNCTFVVYYLKENLFMTNKKESLINAWREKCEYIAMCEGDDYWIKDNKLQLQVSYLKSHPDISLCFHAVKFKNMDGTISCDNNTEDVPETSSIKELADGNFIQTPTVVMRYFPSVFETKSKMGLTYVGDYILWMLCATHGNIYKFADVMAMYRTGVGIWSSGGGKEWRSKWIVMLSKLYPYMPHEIQLMLDQKIDVHIGQIRASWDEVYNSYSWRLGHMLIGFISKIKNLFRSH